MLIANYNIVLLKMKEKIEEKIPYILFFFLFKKCVFIYFESRFSHPSSNFHDITQRVHVERRGKPIGKSGISLSESYTKRSFYHEPWSIRSMKSDVRYLTRKTWTFLRASQRVFKELCSNLISHKTIHQSDIWMEKKGERRKYATVRHKRSLNEREQRSV